MKSFPLHGSLENEVRAVWQRTRAQTTSFDWIFLLVTLGMVWGFLHFDVRDVWFAKIGIPLGSSSGTSLGSKLFITEIYFLFIAGLVALGVKQIPWARAMRNPLLLAILGFCSVAALRAAPDFLESKMLVVRNLSFVWYLALPLLLYLSPIRTVTIESLLSWTVVLGALYFFGSILLSFFTFHISPYWIPFLGVYAFYFVTLSGTKERWTKAFLALLGIALGIGAIMGFQRTNLLGLLLLTAPAGYFAFQNSRFAIFGKRIALLLLIAVLSFGALLAARHFLPKMQWDQDQQTRFSSPFVKSDLNSGGVEVFRGQMWADAFQLFREQPLWGIGFRNQVVYRLWMDPGEFVPNDGVSWAIRNGVKIPPAPISGPHNSYLNSITRMGIFGAAILLLHLWALWTLFQTGYFFSFFVVYAQILYAFFNVGLEGPSRSFFLLLGLAVALRSIDESRAQTDAPIH